MVWCATRVSVTWWRTCKQMRYWVTKWTEQCTYILYGMHIQQSKLEKRCTKCVWCWGTMTDTWTSCLLVIHWSVLYCAPYKLPFFIQPFNMLTIPPSSSSQRPTPVGSQDSVWPSPPFPLRLTSVFKLIETKSESPVRKWGIGKKNYFTHTVASVVCVCVCACVFFSFSMYKNKHTQFNLPSPTVCSVQEPLENKDHWWGLADPHSALTGKVPETDTHIPAETGGIPQTVCVQPLNPRAYI